MTRLLGARLACVGLLALECSVGLKQNAPEGKPLYMKTKSKRLDRQVLKVNATLNPYQCAHAYGMQTTIEACEDAKATRRIASKDRQPALENCWSAAGKFREEPIGAEGNYAEHELGPSTTYVMHLPRTGTCSALAELRKEVGFYHIPGPPGGHYFHSGEGCFEQSKQGFLRQTPLVMLRHPHAHVLSMFFECVNSTTWPWSSEAKASMPDFWSWVEAWGAKEANGTSHGLQHPHADQFKCYRPIDMQTHRLSCNAWEPYQHDEPEADIQLAVQNLEGAKVGLLEAYDETMCLWLQFLAKEKVYGCDCSNKKTWKKIPEGKGKEVIHLTHGVKHPQVEAYPGSVWDAVDQITKNDMKLYKVAVRQFTDAAREQEEEYGTKLLCNWDQRFGKYLKD